MKLDRRNKDLNLRDFFFLDVIVNLRFRRGKIYDYYVFMVEKEQTLCKRFDFYLNWIKRFCYKFIFDWVKTELRHKSVDFGIFF